MEVDEDPKLSEGEEDLEDKKGKGKGEKGEGRKLEEKPGHVYAEQLLHNGVTYLVGDFLDVSVEDNKTLIIQIHQLWTQSSNGQKGFSGFAFYRSGQTYHLPTKKFFEREVFKTTDFRELFFKDKVTEKKCCVLFLKDFIRGKPTGFRTEDTYVCESRYNEIAQSFHPIKVWKSCIPQPLSRRGELHPALDLYENPLVLSKNVPSVYFDQASTPTARKVKSKGDFQVESREDSPMEEVEEKKPKPRGRPAKAKAWARSEENSESEDSAPETPRGKRYDNDPDYSAKKKQKKADSVEYNAPMLSATKDKDSGVSPFLFKWTIRETMELIKGIQKYGAGNWLNIMEDDEFKKAFPLRNTSTNAYLRDRWKTLARRGNEPPTVAELEEAERHLGADNYNFLGWINDQREKVKKQKALTKAGMTSVIQGIPSVDPNERNIPLELVQDFTHRDNRIVWFPTPPLYVEWPQPLKHSAAYLAAKKAQEAVVDPEQEEKDAIQAAQEAAKAREAQLLQKLKAFEQTLLQGQ